MKTIEELLKNLGRANVLEFGLVTNRLPSVNIGGKFEPVDDEAPTTDTLLQMLIAMGGSRYVESLSENPVQWTTRLDGIGVIAIAAIMRKDVIQARFTVARREAAVAAAKGNAVPPPSKARPASPDGGPLATTKGIGSSSPSEDSEDDDEPTVQTASPPVGPAAPPHQRPARDGDGVARASIARAALTTDLGIERTSLVDRAAAKPAPPSADDAKPEERMEAVPTPRGGPPNPPDVAAELSTSTSSGVRGDSTLDSFLALAASEKASDVHIVADRPLLLRIATELVPRTQPIPAAHVERIVGEIVPARLRAVLENEGSSDFALEHAQHGRFRVNVSRQRTGFKISMRVIPRGVPSIASLGLPDGIAKAASYHQGLVLVTGPTGQGKTTTLAAIVDLINTESKHHVLTVEDPVEYVHPRKNALMSQREVGSHTRTFAAALKASLREDPDVIVVGELRDAETVRMAVAASETGHLVIGTMNTPSAAKTIDRLIDLFPPAEQSQVRTSVAGALRLIIGQRLVPSSDRTRLHPAVELLPTSIALYTIIRDAKTYQISSLQQRGKSMGVVRLDESLAELVRTKKVTIDVAKQFAEAPAELETLVRGGVPAPVPTPRK